MGKVAGKGKIPKPDLLAPIALAELRERLYPLSTNDANLVIATIKAAAGLYERVQMDESVGICLSERATCLLLGDLLVKFDFGND